MVGATGSSGAANASFQGAEGALEPATDSSGAATDTSSTAEGDSDAELRASMQLVEAVEREAQDERQNVLRWGHNGLSVDAGSDSSRRMQDVEFRLKKDGWMLISPFSKEQLGSHAHGLVKSMTQ